MFNDHLAKAALANVARCIKKANTKQAFVPADASGIQPMPPPGGAPGAMPPGAMPPGGAPPGMDPSAMMAGGGGAPMDPSMAGGMPPEAMAGGPPSGDPNSAAAAAGAPPEAPPEAASDHMSQVADALAAINAKFDMLTNLLGGFLESANVKPKKQPKEDKPEAAQDPAAMAAAGLGQGGGVPDVTQPDPNMPAGMPGAGGMPQLGAGPMQVQANYVSPGLKRILAALRK